MAKGVFIQNPESIYDDEEGAHYHYPKSYHKRVLDKVGDWVVLYQSGKSADGMTYYAVAEVARTRPDLKREGHFYADYVPGSYLDFAKRVPLKRNDQSYYSSNIQKEPGKPNGRVQSAVQTLKEDDFWEILRIGTEAESHLLMPRRNEDISVDDEVHDTQSDFDTPFQRDRVETFLNRAKRDRTFRACVLSAYGERCAFTGLGFINGGGRAEVQAAHIRPVERDGVDSVTNGLALSGTIHWMFDRGLLGVGDEREILISRKVNDVGNLDRLLNSNMLMRQPEKIADSPHPDFLRWHREHVFEH